MFFPPLLLLILCAWSAEFTAPRSSANENVAYQDILKAELSWENANLHHDDAALREVLAPEFVQINEDGSVTPRDEAIAKLRGSTNQPQQCKVDKRTIVIHGDTAILTAEYIEVGRSPKGYYRVVLNIADVFRCSQRTWKGEVGYSHLVDLKSGESSPLPLEKN